MKNDPTENDQKKPQHTARKNAKWLARAILWPKSFLQMGVWSLAWLTLWPTGMALFPRAEQVLEQEGLNPKIVEELAPGQKVYVRTDNFAGKFHALLDLGIVLSPVTYYTTLRDEVNGGFTRRTVVPKLLGMCEVYLKTSQYKDREHYQMALLHEIRHCSDDNGKLMTGSVFSNVFAEGDADYNAIRVLAREKKQPELEKYFLNREAAWFFDKDHDTALYLDAKFRKAAMPSAKEMSNASDFFRGATKKMGGGATLNVEISCEKDKPDICEYTVDGQKLSAVTARRFQLFLRSGEKEKQPKPMV